MEPFNFQRGRDADDKPKFDFPSELPLRKNNWNTTGKPVNIQVNQYKVTDWIKGDVQQYDVSSPHPHFVMTLTLPSTSLCPRIEHDLSMGILLGSPHHCPGLTINPFTSLHPSHFPDFN